MSTLSKSETIFFHHLAEVKFLHVLEEKTCFSRVLCSKLIEVLVFV